MKRAGDDARQLPGRVRSRSRSTKLNRISLRPTFVSSADDSVETTQTQSHPPDAPLHHIPDVHIPPRHPGRASNQQPPSRQDVQRQSGRRIIQAQILHDESALAECQPNAMNRQPTRTVPKTSQLNKNDSHHHPNVLGGGEMAQDASQTNKTLPRKSTSQERSPDLTKIHTRLPDRSKIQNKWSKITSRTSPSTTDFLPLKESVIIGESPGVCY
ncbi:uncharacterized protein LOC124267573 [Haliotis rubra]|uniref:uncharacterized protein LOC124267573 n=1 Tax=Haliotis rubra TaxID=36100 RepID=UPI001EE5D610|nr:uncharacterized protein LOC124267573 [Haliotis rubra]